MRETYIFFRLERQSSLRTRRNSKKFSHCEFATVTLREQHPTHPQP